ncbi:MAG: hypothetical protein M1546_00680 [Chloroflexi bacterium]|nr:hypothetical protein [Chloroflexota bacterium]
MDFAWAAFVLHEVTPLDQVALELRRVARRVAVLEWRPDAAGAGGPPSHHRLWPHQIMDVLHNAGFESVAQTWQDEDHYLVEAGRGHLAPSQP